MRVQISGISSVFCCTYAIMSLCLYVPGWSRREDNKADARASEGAFRGKGERDCGVSEALCVGEVIFVLQC